MELATLLSAVSEYEQALERCLVLDAARNVMSPGARALLGSRLANGDLAGRAKEWGSQYAAAPARTIEDVARGLVDRLFGTPHVELRALSGSLANGLATIATTRPGDVLLMPPQWAFGHKSVARQGYPGSAARTVAEMPWDGAALGPDLDGLRRVLKQRPPQLVVLGLSRPLFPEPMAEVAALAKEADARLLYDGAHVLGLIAGGAFPNPLLSGFDMLTGSTHKTLPGPTGGVVICRDPDTLEGVASLCDAWLSTYSNSRIAALAHTMAEMVTEGPAYTHQVVENARALARGLAAEGFPVVGAHRGFTATHQVLVDITDIGQPGEVVGRLAAATILINSPAHADQRLRDGRNDGWWLRLGTSAVTRLGMKEEEMPAIACILARLLLRREDPSIVAGAVAELVEAFETVWYTIPEGTAPGRA